jgi:hypothetical protein
MTCQDCEFALGCDQSSAAIAEHLLACPACCQLFEDLKANAEALESMSAEEMPRVPVKVGRPVLPAAIGAFALAAAAAVAMILVSIPREEKLPPVHYALAPMKFEIPALAPPVKRERPREPLMVKMLTSDPNVVIYWQIETDGENQ